MRCYCKILHISYKDHVTNDKVCAKVQHAIGPHEDLLMIVRDTNCSGMVMSPIHKVWPKPSCKAQWKGEEDKARQRRRWEDKHQGMDRPRVRQVPEGNGEQGKIEKIGCKIIYGAPTTLAVKRLITLTMTFSYSHPPHPTHTPSLSWSCHTHNHIHTTCVFKVQKFALSSITLSPTFAKTNNSKSGRGQKIFITAWRSYAHGSREVGQHKSI